MVAADIRVYGLVQGVGFRPFLYRCAEICGITGRVLNRNDCVQIIAEGRSGALDDFVASIRENAPPMARVERIERTAVDLTGFTDFSIDSSRSVSDSVTRVAPDTAVCDDCLADMQTQSNRIAYPFTNCTNCGPRFTIIEALPYDRASTTMRTFKMCESCRSEYENVTSRRFHAQPNACARCGPVYTLIDHGDAFVRNSDMPDMREAPARTAVAPSAIRATASSAVRIAAKLLESGKVVAIKGIGGFHLACDATNKVAVQSLRDGKRREGKPFAVMCRDIVTARKLATMSDEEESLLISPRRPIVLLRASVASEPSAASALTPISPLAPGVSVGLDTIGIMLPYAPIHYVLFEHLRIDVLVMTSGNLSDEPIAISNETARLSLGAICSALLVHNRDIHNRADDSIAHVVRSIPRIVRRSRGWVPEPIPFEGADGIAAVGAELKNVFCIGKDNEVILSQHIGDIKIPAAYSYFEESFNRLCRLFRFEPKYVACDLHPEYASTKFAESLGLPVTYVQHHHAHIASILAAAGKSPRAEGGKVIGVAFDGTGYGTDANIWGGEFLIASLTDFERYAHVDYMGLPGGDKAVEEPWRIALTMLHAAGEDSSAAGLFPNIDTDDLDLVLSMIEKGVNTPLSSGVGRLFDGVAALSGIATYASYEAEGPMKLEALLPDDWTDFEPYCFEVPREPRNETLILSWRDVAKEIVKDLRSGATPMRVSARFHAGLANLVLSICEKIRDERGIDGVALSGGVFQNRSFLAHSEALLEEAKFTLILAPDVPVNDGGVCLGQLAVAAASANAGKE